MLENRPMQVLPCSNENEIYTVSVLPKALSTTKPFLWCMHIKYCIVAQQSSAVTSYINLLQLSMMCMLALKTGGLSKSSISPSDRSEALIKGVSREIPIRSGFYKMSDAT